MGTESTTTSPNTVTVVLPPDLMNKLRAIADAEDRTPDQQARHLVRKALETLATTKAERNTFSEWMQWANVRVEDAREDEGPKAPDLSTLCGARKTGDLGYYQCVFPKNHEGPHSWEEPVLCGELSPRNSDVPSAGRYRCALPKGHVGSHSWSHSSELYSLAPRCTALHLSTSIRCDLVQNHDGPHLAERPYGNITWEEPA